MCLLDFWLDAVLCLSVYAFSADALLFRGVVRMADTIFVFDLQYAICVQYGFRGKRYCYLLSRASRSTAGVA